MGGVEDVALPGPEDAAQHPAAIEREARYEVENADRGVDSGEVGQHAAGASSIGCEERSRRARRRRRWRSWSAGRRMAIQNSWRAFSGSLRQVRDAAKDEERDARDWYAVSPRDERVGHLMQRG